MRLTETLRSSKAAPLSATAQRAGSLGGTLKKAKRQLEAGATLIEPQ